MTITITNKLGQKTLGKGGYRLVSTEGFTAADYAPYIIDYGLIDGGRFHSSRVPPRKLKMIFSLFGGESENERQNLIGFFNPKLSHTIQVERNGLIMEIDGYVSAFKTEQESIERPITATLEMICPDPFFRDHIPVTSVYAYFSPQISFPMIFKSNGIIAGYSIAENELSVINGGHDQAGFVIDLQCVQGSVKNIRVENRESGEFILFNGSLNEGDRLKISTVNGDKYVTVNGENSISSISRQSSFFGLDVGNNTIVCSSDSSRKCFNINLTFTPRFLGV